MASETSALTHPPIENQDERLFRLRSAYSSVMNDVMDRVLAEIILPDDRAALCLDAAQYFTFLMAVKITEVRGQDSGKPVTDIVLSSNVGGLDVKVADPGVAAWFKWDGAQRCVAVDRYPKPEDNLQAIHHVIEARRTELRHGGLHIVRQTFKGFTALPAPKGATPPRDWRAVLGFTANDQPTREHIDAAYREAAKKAHPDKAGGSAEKMAALNVARAEALAAFGG